MKTAHIFYYRFPGIKEGLTHETFPFTWGMPREVEDSVPLGSFIYLDGEWYRKGFARPNGKNVYQVKQVAVLTIEAHLVPAPIKAMALLLT